ncbi:MAG: polysaccharide biosynthesis/export family protein [Planctomycetota bacterium]
MRAKPSDHQVAETRFPVWRIAVAVVAALVLTGCKADHRISLDEFRQMRQTTTAASGDQPAGSPADVDRQLGPYKIGPGDVLEVTLTGPQGALLPATAVRVDRNGSIDLPIIGAVDLDGLELEDAEDRIRAAYVPRVYGEAVCHVALKEPDATFVLVVGAVTQPGLAQLKRNERNMLYAIVAAGGVSEAASGNATLRRVRTPDESATFDLTDPRGLQSALSISPLQDGDILTVEAATPNTLFVGGLVRRASPQVYPSGTKVTVLQALAAAQGLRTDVTPRQGTLIHRLPDGGEVQVRLDLDKIACGEEENVALAAGDILWVPDTFETRVQDFINRNIFLRAGVSVNYNVSGVEFMNRNSQQNGTSRGGQQDSFDPLGFLSRGSALQDLVSRPGP